jgi:putative endonuclease
MYYTYILRCADDTLYTGYCADPDKRLAEHNSGKGAKYTRSRLPVELVYSETFETKSEAMRREANIKAMTKAKKERLCESGFCC